MIYIKKTEPQWYKDFILNNHGISYSNFYGKNKDLLRDELLKEQGYVCCFCGIRIKHQCLDNSNDTFEFINIESINLQTFQSHGSRISHIIPQKIDPSLSMKYSNLCLSCDTQNTNPKIRHCDESQKNNIIEITPLQEDCISFFQFSVDGKIKASRKKSKTDQKKANNTISVLHLNEPSLVQKRKNFIDNISKMIEDKKLSIDEVNNSLLKRDENGAFSPFYFLFPRYTNAI